MEKIWKKKNENVTRADNELISPSNLTREKSFDFATIFEKTSTCDIHTEISYKTEINKHIACGFSVFANYSHD